MNYLPNCYYILQKRNDKNQDTGMRGCAYLILYIFNQKSSNSKLIDGYNTLTGTYLQTDRLVLFAKMN